jgi:hypothetical protein
LFIPIGVFIIIGSSRFLTGCKDLLLAVNNRIGRSEGEGSLGKTSVFKTLFLKFVTTFLSAEGGFGVVGGVIAGRNILVLSPTNDRDGGTGLIFPISA